MILRELASKIVIDVRAAVANVKKFDDAMDGARDGIQDLTDDAVQLGEKTEKTARRSKKAVGKIEQAWNRLRKEVKKNKKEIKDAGAKIVGTFRRIGTGALAAKALAVGLTLAWAAQAQELDNLSKRYAVTTDEIQGFTGALRGMGLDSEEGLEALKELRLRMGEAAQTADSPLKDALTDLGIQFESFEKLGFIDQLGLLGDRLLEVKDKGKRFQIADAIGAEDFIRILPLIEEGSDAIKELTGRAQKLNQVQSKDSIAAGVKLQKSWKSLLGLFISVRNTIAAKLEPTFTKIIDTTTKWIRENRKLIDTKVTEFIERLVNLAQDFLPVALKFAESVLDIVEALGGVGSAIETVVSAMAIWKIATLALLGPAGPWIAGLLAVTAALRIFGNRVDAEDRRITRLAGRRSKDLKFRTEKEFTTEELERQGEAGQEVLLLEETRNRLIARREALGIGGDIEEARESGQANIRSKDLGAGVTRFLAINKLDKALDEQIRQAGILETAIKSVDDSIQEQLGLIRSEQVGAQRDKAREKATETAKETKGTAKERERTRELLALLRADKLKGAGKKELRGLIARLGLDTPESLKRKKGGAGKKSKEDELPTIAELVGLGPKGIETIGDLVPKGQGTTINNFNFSTVVQSPQVTINNNLPEGTDAAAVATQTSRQLGGTLSDIASADQRELVGQLQG